MCFYVALCAEFSRLPVFYFLGQLLFYFSVWSIFYFKSLIGVKFLFMHFLNILRGFFLIYKGFCFCLGKNFLIILALFVKKTIRGILRLYNLRAFWGKFIILNYCRGVRGGGGLSAQPPPYALILHMLVFSFLGQTHSKLYFIFKFASNF